MKSFEERRNNLLRKIFIQKLKKQKMCRKEDDKKINIFFQFQITLRIVCFIYLFYLYYQILF